MSVKGKLWRATPIIVTAAVLVACIAYVMHLNRGSLVVSQRIVTVDLVKVMNAERAALPTLANGGDPSIALLRIGRAIIPTVKEIAGDNALVLVRQAVVGADNAIPDITDQVLEKLGLPKNAPTINLSKGLMIAPTTANAQAGDLFKKRAEALRKRQSESLKAMQKNHAENQIP